MTSSSSTDGTYAFVIILSCRRAYLAKGEVLLPGSGVKWGQGVKEGADGAVALSINLIKWHAEASG